MEVVRRIKTNMAQCLKCRDYIESTFTHDYQSCHCGAIAIDGGKSYLKRSAKDFKFFKDMSEYYGDK